MNHKEHVFFSLLRFFNLLEPGKHVLSISKIFMWLMMGVLIFVVIYHPQNLAAVIAATGSQFVAAANYAFRRHVQSRGGEDRNDMDSQPPDGGNELFK